MADIKQAAEWPQRGFEIRRTCWRETGDRFASSPLGFFLYISGNIGKHDMKWTDMVCVSDVLANDWEIAE